MDSLVGLTYEPEKRPEVSNLLRIFAALSSEEPTEVAERFASSNNASFKAALADQLVEHFRPIQDRMATLSQDPAYVHSVLQEGAKVANELAHQTMTEVHDLLGLGPLPILHEKQ